MDLTSIISLIGTGIGILAILILLFKQKEKSFRNIVFGLTLFCITYYVFLAHIFNSGKILDLPHFFKTGSPVFYLLPISIYWLGQSYINQKRKLKPFDYVLMLIPFLNFIENIPIYILSASEKQMYLSPMMEDRDQIIYFYQGWIPTYFHFLIQVTMGLIVSIHLFWGTLRKLKKDSSAVEARNCKWLIFFSALFLIFYLSTFLMLIFDNETFQAHQTATWLFSITILALLVLLFLEPSILYGNTYSTKPSSTQKEVIIIEEAEAQKYREAIEHYFLTDENYLHPDFRQQDMADFLDIPKNKLSLIINQLFDQNFNQLINEKRIEMAIHKLQRDEFKNFTLEGISQEVGFKSRTTFIKAFQEKTGQTPSEFRKKVLNS